MLLRIPRFKRSSFKLMDTYVDSIYSMISRFHRLFPSSSNVYRKVQVYPDMNQHNTEVSLEVL